ncbi:uncharacterized protein BDR25DRAFT_246316 [Lindgomyces ingoldianus]|uniref:Uncharacterized protein n=1 Tax=Lindgomyces ingoldianus TaxID=673940 RepID=A0ACB6QAH2_9PLEO|nr:uncharacterized protein BDR25DRAFT_246316 [Lindgomyces ingoldianus]KAF2463146.1 hypothetical protein BDR25DRAFT_246316 [Lindgomyces ingoldianus]
MPRFLHPKSSTPHRVAAIALYRALLSRCSCTPLPDECRNALQNALRNKFRRNRKIQSPYQLGLAFRAGYETLDHLDGARTGDEGSIAFITSFISTLPPGMTRPPPPRRPQPPPHPSKNLLACLAPERAVLHVRPYAHVPGPRKVPILASANGIPFLRLGKPQPLSLSRILRQKLDKKIERFDKKMILMNYWRPIAEYEDRWDDIISTHFGVLQGEGNRRREEGEVTWAYEVEQAMRENASAHERDLNRDKAIAWKMQRIVDKETALALEEGEKIVRGRRGRKEKS